MPLTGLNEISFSARPVDFIGKPDRAAAAQAIKTEGYRAIEGAPEVAAAKLKAAGFLDPEIQQIIGSSGAHAGEQAAGQVGLEQAEGKLSKERANLSPAMIAERDARRAVGVPEDQLLLRSRPVRRTFQEP